MIESVTVTNYLGVSREMVLADPEPSGFIVKSIDGLGPATANINFSELVTIDGAIENSAKLNTREIKIDLIFLENPTIEDTRHQTYQFFPVKKPVTLTVKTKTFERTRVLHCYGTVEKNDPKIFSQQEGCSITIKCGDPSWHSETFTKKMFYGTEPLFEFPFSNESTQEVEVDGRDDIVEARDYRVEALYKEFEPYTYFASLVHLEAGLINSQRPFIDMLISKNPGSPYYVRVPSGGRATIYQDDSFVIELDFEGGYTNIYSGVWSQDDFDKYYTNIIAYTQSPGGTALVGDVIEFGDIKFLTEGVVDYAGDINYTRKRQCFERRVH